MACDRCNKFKDKYSPTEEGDIRRVFLGDTFEGEAILLEQRDDMEVPYILERCLVCGDYINLIKERWDVWFIGGKNAGWETTRKIPVWHSFGLIHIEDGEDEEE